MDVPRQCPQARYQYIQKNVLYVKPQRLRFAENTAHGSEDHMIMRATHIGVSLALKQFDLVVYSIKFNLGPRGKTNHGGAIQPV